jgi:hypothetical protein
MERHIDEDLIAIKEAIGGRSLSDIPAFIAEDENAGKTMVHLLVSLFATRNINEKANGICTVCDGKIEDSRKKEAKLRGILPSTCIKCDSDEFTLCS